MLTAISFLRCSPSQVREAEVRFQASRSLSEGLLTTAGHADPVGACVAYPQVIEAEFKRPCFLPASVQCLIRGEADACDAALSGSVEFEVVADDSPLEKQVIRGRVGFCVAT